MAILYQDFLIYFMPESEETFKVKVQSPAGNSGSVLRMEKRADENGLELRHLIDHWSTRLGNFRDLRVSPSGESLDLSPEKIGGKLFRSVFHGRIRDLLNQSIGITQGRDQGLRLVLQFDLRETATERLSRLPWEFLYNEELEDFLALSPRTPVVRSLDSARSKVLPPLRDIPRALAVIASAEDLQPLDENKEKEILVEAFRDSGVEFQVLDAATPRKLTGALGRRDFHILHYIGHGAFDGEGMLFLRGEDGMKKPLRGSDLASMLRRARNLRFVFLNACETALTSNLDGRNPFAGVASALVDNGVPAVLAMQAPIPDKAAIDFSHDVYNHLAQGGTLEEAVTHGRSGLHSRNPQSAWWSVPVFFTRVHEQVIEPASLHVLGLLWTFLAFATATLSFNTWSQTQGWNIHVPGIGFSLNEQNIVSIYGILWGLPLLSLLLLATEKYFLYRRGGSFVERLPVAFGLRMDKMGSLRRLYQASSFCVFLLMPMLAQIHFFHRMHQGIVYDGDKPLSSIWDMIPIVRMGDDHWNYFHYGSQNHVTFYPFWEPLLFLVLEIAVLGFFLRVSYQLFFGQKGPAIRLPKPRRDGR